ncbi:hypothetical protein CEXT_143031, partial [Caerostris extrusa]
MTQECGKLKSFVNAVISITETNLMVQMHLPSPIVNPNPHQ